MPLAGNPEVWQSVKDNQVPRFGIGNEGHQEKGAADFLDEGCLNDACLRVGLGEVDVIRQGVHANVILGHCQQGERCVGTVRQASECLRILAALKNLTQ